MEENKKRKRHWERLMNRFTDDLWIQVFLRLPIKPLLRFKLVSKSWFSIISSHRFAISHLAANKDDETLIVHNDLDNDEEDNCSFSLLDLDSGRIFKNLNFPYSQGEYPPLTSSKLIGSDCGIVCVCVCSYSCPALKRKYDIYLWNPATKHSKLIPAYTIPDYGLVYSFSGFGFDQIDMDFKVVRVVSPTLSAEVYSSNNNTWRMIQSKPTDIPPGIISGIFHLFHGFLFAIGRKFALMAFDLNKEVFICDINLPVRSFDDAVSFIDTRVTDFNDTIAVILCILIKGKINLWTLDNEACVCSGGVEATWTKVLSIDVGVDVGVPLQFVEGLFNNVQFVLTEIECQRFLYNWKNKVTTDIQIYPTLECGEFFKYTKSLFSLVGFKHIKWAASSASKVARLAGQGVQMDE